MKRATLALAAVVLGGFAAWRSIANLGPNSGLDLRKAVWAPTHGLMAGFNPYEASTAYLTAFGVDFPAAIHAPSLLLLTAPIAVNDRTAAYAAMTVASILALWLSVVLVIPPDTWRNTIGAVLLGALLMFTGPAEDGLLLGQVTSIAVLGLALVVRAPRSWAGAVGVAFLCTSPQFAVPFSILLLGMGIRRSVIYGWGLTVVASLPALTWAAVNAGGVQPLVTSLLASMGSSNTTDISRVDIPGGYLDGDYRATVVLLALTVVASIWLHRRKVALTPTTVLVATSWSLLATYSRPYSLPLVLLVAVPVLLGNRRGSVEWFALAVVGVGVIASIPVRTLAAQLSGVEAGRILLVLTVLYAPLLVGIVVSGVIRLARDPGAGGRQGVEGDRSLALT